MEQPVLIFDLDMMFPWVPAIYRGFKEIAFANRARVLLGRYQGYRLIDVTRAMTSLKSARYGVISDTLQDALQWSNQKIPTVWIGVSDSHTGQVVSVATDYREMGAVVARELMRCGYMSFGIISHPTGKTSLQFKEQGFRDTITSDVGQISLLTCPNPASDIGWLDEAGMNLLTEWMSTLQHPIGIAAGNVRLAWSVARAARRVGKRIPEDIGLVAIGDDPVLLSQSTPPISGVAENGVQIGRAAAGLLFQIIKGETGIVTTTIKPESIVRRASTDFIADQNPLVRRALKILWTDSLAEMDVDKLARSLHVSRATLLRRFKESRRHSPSQEIYAARIHRAIDLITSSAIPFAEIAEQTGFGLQSAFNHAIRKTTGKTPTQLRVKTV